VESPHDSRYSDYYPEDDTGNLSKRPDDISQSEISRNLDENVPISFLTNFQEALGNKFTEMLGFHSKLMSEFNQRDIEREEKIRSLVNQIVDFSKKNSTLLMDNQRMRNLLMESRH